MFDHPRSVLVDRKPLFKFHFDRGCNFDDIVIRRFSFMRDYRTFVWHLVQKKRNFLANFCLFTQKISPDMLAGADGYINESLCRLG